MDSLLFLIVLACLLLVAGWYVGNEMRGAKGDWGLLAVISAVRERVSADAARYRQKLRRAPGASHNEPATGRPGEAAGEEPARYKTPESRPRFHGKDGSGYRTRGPLPRFGERPAGPAADTPEDERD